MLIQEESFLGLDLSTQSLTAVLISLSGGLTHQFSIPFDEAYPSFQTRGGVRVSESSSEVFADPRMWAQALDDISSCSKTPLDRFPSGPSVCRPNNTVPLPEARI